MAITEYNYIPEYTRLGVNNKPKDVITASYWNGLFNTLSHQGDHTAKELGNVLNHFTTVITGVSSETADAIAEEHEYASAFEIHLSTNTNPITADKTFVEIRQAIVDKREILLWVSEVQCLKPTCKAFEHTITLVVFDYSPAGPVVRADVYECYDEDEWFIEQNIELAKQNDIGDIRDLTTTHKYNLVAAVNDKQDKLIAGDNITIAADGKTISATGGSSASIAMRVNSGYIQYSTDNGATWSNLIAEADLKGDKGDAGPKGEQGPSGVSPTISLEETASGVLIDVTDSAGTSTAYVLHGDKGDTGPQGPQGPKGDTGSAGANGKSAYQYAVEGGYTGTETKFAEKLAQEQLTGATNELTPTQVYNAVSVGIPVKVQYADSTYGLLSFTAFNVAESLSMIVSQTIVYANGGYILAELIGNKSNSIWNTMFTVLAEKADIPVVPTALKNPNALTIKIGSTTVTYDGSTAQTVTIDDGTEVSY